MSKTVTIPSGDNPFICKINDVYYSYPAGAVVEVPDEVAALIQANAGNREEPDNKPDIAIPRDGEVDDVLTRTAYGAAWKAPSGGGGQGGSNVLVVHLDNDTNTLDKTWQEIHDADCAMIRNGDDDYTMWMLVLAAETESGPNYYVLALGDSGTFQLNANSANGYPVLDTSGGN